MQSRIDRSFAAGAAGNEGVEIRYNKLRKKKKT